MGDPGRPTAADAADTAAPRLAVRGLEVVVGGRRVLERVDLAVASGEVVAVLGPSGGGKTTLLRALCGLAPVTAGTVEVDGVDQSGMPTHRRGIGMLFQDHALFPHRDVATNVAFGLRMAGTPAAARRARVAEVLALVGLDGAERRRVTTLSGGEAQRVALARALAPRPRLLLLDEPLGSLDRVLHDRLVDDLRRVVREAGLTVVHVTHDQREALRIADRVALLSGGTIVQDGAPATVWRRPVDEAVAGFLGLSPVIDAQVRSGQIVVSGDDGAAVVLSSFDVAASGGVGPVPDGPCRVLVHPDALDLRSGAEGSTGSTGATGSTDRHGRTVHGAVVVDVAFDGLHSEVAVAVDGIPALADLRLRVAGTPPTVGARVSLEVRAAAMVVFGNRAWGVQPDSSPAGSTSPIGHDTPVEPSPQ